MNQRKTKRSSLSEVLRFLATCAISALLFSPLSTDAQAIYRWVDANGTVHYSHQPPQDSAHSSFDDAPQKELERQPSPTKVNEHQPVPFGRGLLWKIELAPSQTDRVAPCYILGTMHSEDPRVLQLPTEVQQALSSSDNFCMELVADTTATTTLAKRMVYTDGQTLQTVVGEQLFQQLTPLMGERGVPAQALVLLKPWAVYMTLSMPQKETGTFLDLQLYEMAKQQGKPVCGLETAEEQVSVFEKTPVEDQIVLLRELVKSPHLLEKQIEQMTTKYLARDLAGLLALSQELQPATPNERRSAEGFLRRLIEERNGRMVERIVPRLQQGSTFIAVGVLHLPGPSGILQLLTDRGYLVSNVY